MIGLICDAPGCGKPIGPGTYHVAQAPVATATAVIPAHYHLQCWDALQKKNASKA